MADNYLEKHYDDYLKRKAAWEKSVRNGKPKSKPGIQRPDDEAL